MFPIAAAAPAASSGAFIGGATTGSAIAAAPNANHRTVGDIGRTFDGWASWFSYPYARTSQQHHDIGDTLAAIDNAIAAGVDLSAAKNSPFPNVITAQQQYAARIAERDQGKEKGLNGLDMNPLHQKVIEAGEQRVAAIADLHPENRFILRQSLERMTATATPRPAPAAQESPQIVTTAPEGSHATQGTEPGALVGAAVGTAVAGAPSVANGETAMFWGKPVTIEKPDGTKITMSARQYRKAHGGNTPNPSGGGNGGWGRGIIEAVKNSVKGYLANSTTFFGKLILRKHADITAAAASSGTLGKLATLVPRVAGWVNGTFLLGKVASDGLQVGFRKGDMPSAADVTEGLENRAEDLIGSLSSSAHEHIRDLATRKFGEQYAGPIVDAGATGLNWATTMNARIYDSFLHPEKNPFGSLSLENATNWVKSKFTGTPAPSTAPQKKQDYKPKMSDAGETETPTAPLSSRRPQNSLAALNNSLPIAETPTQIAATTPKEPPGTPKSTFVPGGAIT